MVFFLSQRGSPDNIPLFSLSAFLLFSSLEVGRADLTDSALGADLPGVPESVTIQYDFMETICFRLRPLPQPPWSLQLRYLQYF